MINPATATAIISNAIPAQNRSQGDEFIVMAKPSFGWIFSLILLISGTGSPLVCKVETRRPKLFEQLGPSCFMD